MPPWHGTAMPWPRHGQAPTPMCPPWCTGAPRGQLARLVAGTRKRQIFTGMRLFPGPKAAGMPAGTRPVGQGLGNCAGWGSSLYFSRLFIPLRRPPGGRYLQCLSHAGTQTKAAEQRTPDLDLARKAPSPSMPKHSLHGEALGGLHWWDSCLAPCGAGASAPLWTRGDEAQWDNQS